MSCCKVMYSKSGKRVGSETFDNYDDALTDALNKSQSHGYLCVVLEFNPKKGIWFKRSTIYPNE